MFLAETELITGGVPMYPTLETIRQLAQTKEYRRIPLCRELYADRYTPVEVMRILRKASRHCYLLESASQTEVWGRYSFLGYEPSMEITCTDRTLKIRTTDAEGKTEETVRQITHPGDTLREIIRKYKTPVMEKMPPFTGGLVGYFSYDYIKYSEPKLKLEDREQQDFRDMDLMLFDQVIVFDHFRQKVLLITGVMADDLEASYEKAVKKLEEMAQLIRNGEHMEFEPLRLQSEIQPKFPKEKYAEMVEKAKHYIREGDIFQVVLSNPMRAKATGSLFDTYRVLRATNPSPYMFYFSSDDIEIAGASPETLAKLENGTLYTFPLAGTRKRGATEEEDFWRYRSLRLNYYAVKALQARAYLYAEMNEDALEAARTVVAVQEKWFPFLEYSAIVGNSKTPNRVFSTELLFCMQNTKRNTIFTSYFTPDLKDDQMYVTPKTFLENIFGTLARNDRRYEPIWLSPSNHDFRCFHKYADIESATFYSNLIPMIRVTEMYYIIAETTTDDIEALNSINLVLENRGLDKLTSKDEIPATILSEYQKEFWGEGQLFFYYKRINASSIPSAMTGGDVEMNDVKYSMPLPESETNFR